MFDLKVINSVLDQLEEERGIPRDKVIEAIQLSLATAYKREYGKRGQIIRASFDINTGTVEMFQVKIVVDESTVFIEEGDVEGGMSHELGSVNYGGEKITKGEEKTKENKGGKEGGENEETEEKEIFNPEKHIMIEDAKRIKKDAQISEEMIFPLENKGDYGRIASQTAKQVIMQKIREAEKTSVLGEYGEREGEIVTGTVQRIERGNIFVDMGRATGILPYNEQIPGEKYNQGERIRAYLYKVEETPRGVFLRLSRSHPRFLEELFKVETPEIGTGVVEIKIIAREAGSRSKVAVLSNDSHIDPVGSLVGQRGVRVSTVTSELGGEKIDIIEWSEDPNVFIEDALSPAKVLNVEIDEEKKEAVVTVSEDQQSLAIGKGGQNVRLAAKLTGWKIDIKSYGRDDDENNIEGGEDKDYKPLKEALEENSSQQLVGGGEEKKEEKPEKKEKELASAESSSEEKKK